MPCGKVMTQPSSIALPILEISEFFTCLLTSLPAALQVLSIETEPVYANIFGNIPERIVYPAAT